MPLRLLSSLRLLIAFVLLSVGLSRIATAQRPVHRFVIDFDVTCHSAPDLASTSWFSIGIATEITVGRVTQANGATWYFDPAYVSGLHPSCWLYGPSTIESNPTDVLPSWLAMVDHQLRRKKLTFEQFVELDNLVADPNRRNIAGHQQLHTSGLLRFRMLQLLEQVLGPAQRNFGELEADPLRKAWLIAHDAQVSYYGPAGVWLVPGTAYWDIYEQNKNAKWAEEVAWIASQHGPSTDACETDCLLGSQLMGGPQQYWQRFPNGPHIAEALRYAADRARLAGTCSEFDTTRDLVEEIRTSLAKVTHPEKLQVLKSLDQLKRPCAK